MALAKTEEKTYPLPLEIIQTFPLWGTIFCLLLGPLMLAFPFIIPVNEIEEGSLIFQILMFYLLIPLSGLFLTAIPIFINFLKKSRFYIDKDGIRAKTMFGNKIVFWKDVVDITTYTLNHNVFLGFVTKEKIEKLNKGGFGAAFGASMGGLYGIAIPLKQIGKLDREKVVLTVKEVFGKIIEKQIAEYKEEESEISADVAPDTATTIEDQTNYFKAGFVSFITATVVGLIYLASLTILHVNFLIIPIIGVMAIFHYFGKHILAKDYSILCRLWMALIGAYSVYLVRIIMIFIFGKILPSPVNIISVLHEYFFVYMPKNVGQEFVWILTAGITIVLGYIQGPSFKLFKRLNSLFMKKLGRIPYEKNEAYYTLYFLQPANYAENTDKFQLEISKGCEIEIDRKKPMYFKLPLDILKKAEIKWPSEFFRKSMDGKFLEIDMGGTGNTKEYVYDTYIICNSEKEIELVKIEVH